MKRKMLKYQKFMLSLILLCALILRLIAVNQSLWLDEAININVAKSLSVSQLIFNYSLGDFHPPLYHLVLKLVSFIYLSLAKLPEYEFIFRIPSVIFGLGSVYLVYKIAHKLYDKRTALTAAVLLATSPLHIYYSHEARMYMLATFFASLSVYFFISLLQKDKLLYWFGFISSTVVMLYSDYLPYFLIPVYIFYLVLNHKKISKSTLRSFIPAGLIILLMLSPWLILFPKQLSGGMSAAAVSPAWAKVVGGAQITNLIVAFVKFIIGRVSLDNNFLYAITLLPVGLFSLLLFVLSLLRNNYRRSFVYFWFLMPIAASFLLAFFIPVFAYFRLLYVLPAMYIILASGIFIVNFPPFNRLLLALFLVINLVSLSFYYLNPKFQREDWRSATQYVQRQDLDKSVVFFESNYTMAPFDYYNRNRVAAHGVLDSFDASSSDIKTKIDKYTVGKNKVYLFQYLSGITDPQGLVFLHLNNAGFINTKTNDFTGVGFVYEFKR